MTVLGAMAFVLNDSYRLGGRRDRTFVEGGKGGE